jgi:hypothetical protein
VESTYNDPNVIKISYLQGLGGRGFVKKDLKQKNLVTLSLEK